MKRKKTLVIVVASLFFLAAAFGVLFFKIFMSGNVQNREATVVVPPGADFEQVMDTLRKHDVLKSEPSFRKAAAALAVLAVIGGGMFLLCSRLIDRHERTKTELGK